MLFPSRSALRFFTCLNVFVLFTSCAKEQALALDLSAFEGSAAAVLERRDALSFRLDGDAPIAVETQYQRSVIVTEAGRRRGEIYAYYNEAFSRVTQMDVKVTAPDGTRQTYTQDDANDYPSAPGYVLFSSSRVLHIDATALTLGSQIETTIVREKREPHLWTFRHIPAREIPVLKTSFAVTVPEGWAVEWACQKANQACPVPAEVSASGGQFEHNRLNGLAKPVASPASNRLTESYAVRLKTYVIPGQPPVTPFADVPALSRYKHALMQPQTHVTKAIQTRAAEVLAGAPEEPETRARLLYSWVRDNIKYCAIEVGMGGWRPHTSTKTFDVGYGDCKDKANLLRSLLKADGIDSNIVTIYSHRGYPQDFGLPTLGGNFNHAILEVTLPSGPVLTDPTTRTVPFGELPFGDQGAHYIVADAAGRDLERSPLSAPQTNPFHWASTVRINEDGQASADVEFSTSGEAARRWRRHLLGYPAAQWSKAVAQRFQLDAASVKNLRITGDAPPLEPVPLTVAFTAERFGSAAALNTEGATSAVLSVRALNDTGLPDVRPGVRSAPMLLGHPRHQTVRRTIVLPERWALRGRPAPIALQTTFGTLTATFTLTDTGVLCEADMVIAAAVVDADQSQAVADFVQQARAAFNPQLLLQRK